MFVCESPCNIKFKSQNVKELNLFVKSLDSFDLSRKVWEGSVIVKIFDVG